VPALGEKLNFRLWQRSLLSLLPTLHASGLRTAAKGSKG
jgi:hypothetical protein